MKKLYEARIAAALGCVIVATGASGAAAADVTYDRLAQAGAAELADEPSRLQLAPLFPHSTPSTRPTSRISSSSSRSRSAAPRATNSTRGDARWSRTASCTSPTSGASFTRSTCAPALPADSSGRWTPAGEARPQPRRRAVGQSRDLGDRSRRARDRDRQGDRQDRVGQEPARPARPRNHRGAARARRIPSSSAAPAATTACATGSPRSIPRPASMQWKTFAIPAPGEPGSETWKDKNNAWQTGGGAFYVTGSYDPATNLTYWGSGNPVPRYDSAYPARRQSLHRFERIAFDAATGKIRWYFQYTPNDIHDYDASGIADHHRRQGQRRRSQDRVACRTATASTTPSTASTGNSSRPPNMPRS